MGGQKGRRRKYHKSRVVLLIFTLMVVNAEIALGGLIVSLYPSFTELLDV